ncbi:MAG: TetR/AcrR family transcriptional regulator [Thermoanaerobaculia bacterium]
MKGDRTRQAILDRAVDLASLEGLEGLTIGRLADELKMSKSGLFAHFGSKEELQLATVETARNRFLEEAFQPALKAERGYPRLLAICRSWLDYVKRAVFPGGCFFAAASFEFDGRPGPVRDAIAKTMDEWLDAIRKAVRLAQDEGHIERSADPAQIAFEMNALFFGANFSYQMRNEKDALERAWTAIEARLSALRTTPSKARAPRRAAKPSRQRQRARR